MHSQGLQHWLEQHSLRIVKTNPLSGGCCANARVCQLSDGRRVFIKTLDEQASEIFAAEAAGLNALAAHKSVRVPDVLFQGDSELVLSFVETASPQPGFEENLALMLCALHTPIQPDFGFGCATFCGLTRQPNNFCADGFKFFAEQRLNYIARRCYDDQRLSAATLKRVEQLSSRLKSLLPEQPAVLIHGDLWQGNVLCNQNNQPVLIDPAAYYGWAEADLAMTRLFGGFSNLFYETYAEAALLEPGWQGRMGLYNLWHLLNHLLLFGGGYLHQVEDTLRRYH